MMVSFLTPLGLTSSLALLGLHIPVGWRQPSYKVKRKTEYQKVNFPSSIYLFPS